MFEIIKDDQKISISDEELFNLILKQCFVEDANPHLLNLDKHIEIISKTLTNDLLKANLSQLFSIYFMAGYYYKVFITKNSVEIKDNNYNNKEK